MNSFTVTVIGVPQFNARLCSLTLARVCSSKQYCSQLQLLFAGRIECAPLYFTVHSGREIKAKTPAHAHTQMPGRTLDGARPTTGRQRALAKARSDSTCMGSSEGRTVLRAAARSAAVTSAASMERRMADSAASRSSATQSAAL